MIEHEVKILDIDPNSVCEILSKEGFLQQEELSFKRVIFDTIPANPNEWIRLRTDGSKTTLTYKKFLQDSIDGVEEVEIEVSDFDNCRKILQNSGFKAKSYQENKRKLFLSKVNSDVEITIDTWPGIPPYVEIEAQASDKVLDIVTRLGFSKDNITSKTTKEIYKKYGININDMPHLGFDSFNS